MRNTPMGIVHRSSKAFNATRHGGSPILLLGLLFMALLLRLYTIGTKTVWLDEAFSIWLANQPLFAMWRWLVQIDQHPPLYYTLLHGWQWLFGDLQGPVRLLSALCSTLTIPFFYYAGRRLFDQPTAILATVILATAPFHVRYAQEARMYALLTLTVAIALYLLTWLLLDNTERQPRWLWTAYGLAQAAVMLTHNTAAVFFPLAVNLAIGGAVLRLHLRGGISALIALNRPGFERRWLRTQLLAFVVWLPWSIPFIIQSIGVAREFWISFPTGYEIYETLHTFHLAHQPYTPIPWLIGDLLYWLLGIAGAWTLRRRGALLSLLLALFFVPILGELVVSLRRPIFSDRTLIWTTLPYYLLVAVGIRQVGRWYAGMGWMKRRGATPRFSVFLLILVVALNVQALISYYRYFSKEGWDEAAAHVATYIEPGDLILFNATWVQLPFDYYFRHFASGHDTRIARHGVPVDLFDRNVLEPKMHATDLPRLQQLLTGHRRIWLIYSHDWYTDPQGLIPRELAQQHLLAAEEHFRGVRVLFYVDQHR
ncbi:MAG: glycosyltransferase family 39 protein [Caldilineaceae bacterium]|nr:glycosyltransferase family 39 protein [Caldilineaceae bacterium]